MSLSYVNIRTRNLLGSSLEGLQESLFHTIFEHICILSDDMVLWRLQFKVFGRAQQAGTWCNFSRGLQSPGLCRIKHFLGIWATWQTWEFCFALADNWIETSVNISLPADGVKHKCPTIHCPRIILSMSTWSAQDCISKRCCWTFLFLPTPDVLEAITWFAPRTYLLWSIHSWVIQQWTSEDWESISWTRLSTWDSSCCNHALVWFNASY